MAFTIDDPAESGLGESDALLLRFDEVTPPSDFTGNHDDCTPVVAGQVPPRVSESPPFATTVTGAGRQFSAGYAFFVPIPVGGYTTVGGDAYDRPTSCGMAAVVHWDFDAQSSYGDDGVIINQGAADTTCFEVRLEVVDPVSRIGRLRCTWQDSGGVEVVIPGGEFVVPTRPFVVVASREQIGSTYYVRLYAAGADLGTYTASTDPLFMNSDPPTIGCRFNDPGSDAYFHGTIDIVHVVARPITSEEAELLNWYVAEAGPVGYILARDSQPSRPDAPGAAPVNVASVYQRELQVEGAAYAIARRNMRRLTMYSLPDRAWGSWLRWWEAALGLPARPGDSIAKRRSRAVAKMSSVLSMSRADLQTQLAEHLGYESDPTLADVVEYDDEYDDDMTELVLDADNLYSSGHAHTAWIRAGNTHTTFTEPTALNQYLQFDQAGTDDLRYSGWNGQAAGSEYNAPMYLRWLGGCGERYPDGGKRMWLRGELRAAPSLPISNLMAGIVIGSVVDDEWLWVGVVWTAVQYNFVSCKYVGGVLSAFTTHELNIGAAPWFFEARHDGDGTNDLGTYTIKWAASYAGLAGATEYTVTGASSRPDWGGYSMTCPSGIASIAGPTQLQFGRLWTRSPDGEAHTNFAVYRDPADAGDYDIRLAGEQLQHVSLYDRSGTVIDRQTGLSVANVKARLDLDPLEH